MISLLIFLSFNPNAIFSYTLRCGNNAYFWKTVFSSLSYGGFPVISSLSKITFPSSASRNPPRIRSRVVLPHPLGPSRVTNSFSYISRLIPFSTTCESKLFTILRNSISFFSSMVLLSMGTGFPAFLLSPVVYF